MLIVRQFSELLSSLQDTCINRFNWIHGNGKSNFISHAIKIYLHSIKYISNGNTVIRCVCRYYHKQIKQLLL